MAKTAFFWVSGRQRSHSRTPSPRGEGGAKRRMRWSQELRAYFDNAPILGVSHLSRRHVGMPPYAELFTGKVSRIDRDGLPRRILRLAMTRTEQAHKIDHAMTRNGRRSIIAHCALLILVYCEKGRFLQSGLFAVITACPRAVRPSREDRLQGDPSREDPSREARSWAARSRAVR